MAVCTISWYGGAGFLHVRRNVYQSMIEKLTLPVCNEHANRPMYPSFQPMVRTAPGKTGKAESRLGESRHIDEPLRKGHWYLAEDYAFCLRAG